MLAKKANQAQDKRLGRTWEGCMKTIATSRAEVPKQEMPLHETKIFFLFAFAFLFLFGCVGGGGGGLFPVCLVFLLLSFLKC